MIYVCLSVSVVRESMVDVEFGFGGLNFNFFIVYSTSFSNELFFFHPIGISVCFYSSFVGKRAN